MPGRGRRRVTAALVGAALLAAGLAACGGSKGAGPAAVLDGYLQAWGRGDGAAMRAAVANPPADLVSTNEEIAATVHATASHYTAGRVVVRGGDASAPVTGALDVKGAGPVTVHATAHLHRDDGTWQVVWTPAAAAAGLTSGAKLSTVTAWPARAPVEGAMGVVLTPSTQTVTVGVVGSRLKDPTKVGAALVAAGFPAGTVQQALSAAAANPGASQPVGTISEDRYAQIAGTVYPLPGTSFASTDTNQTITPDLASHTVGAVGPISAERLASLGAPYTATSLAGTGGLEAADERQLAGSPSLTVVATSPGDPIPVALASRAPVAGRPVVTTLDPTVQKAAEAAMNGTSQTAAMVVIQPSTGNVLASVSRPTASGFDLAFTGQAPPGSTFKVATSTALLTGGLSPTAGLTCPPTITVNGRTFHNDEGESTPTLSFAQAFAVSCNTAFIGAATQHLTGADLVAAARRYGLGVTPKLGLPAYGGSVPTPTSGDELAAASIGQGQTLVSPLAMATLAATAATGTLREPRLVVGAPDDTAPTSTVPAPVIASLHTFMAGVVAPGGTAAPAHLPAGTYGKTGTAEYGSGSNPPSHAWFVGFRGDLAFAVYVDNGVGGTTAAPLATTLLNALPNS